MTSAVLSDRVLVPPNPPPINENGMIGLLVDSGRTHAGPAGDAIF